MLLAINIGNTHTGVVVFEGENIVAQVSMMSAREGIFTNLIAPLWDWYRERGLTFEEPLEVAIASVIPRVNAEFVRFFNDTMAIRPLVISAELSLPLKIAYLEPTQLGADRLCNAVAAHTLYHRPGCPTVIIDIGTATTFEVLSAQGNFMGGPIAPGPATAIANLADSAAQLFDVPIAPQEGAIIATDTENALRAGTYHSALGGIRHILEKITRELGSKPLVIGAGGLAEVFQSHDALFDILAPDITAHGIRIISEYQQIRS